MRICGSVGLVTLHELSQATIICSLKSSVEIRLAEFGIRSKIVFIETAYFTLGVLTSLPCFRTRISVFPIDLCRIFIANLRHLGVETKSNFGQTDMTVRLVDFRTMNSLIS